MTPAGFRGPRNRLKWLARPTLVAVGLLSIGIAVMLLLKVHQVVWRIGLIDRGRFDRSNDIGVGIAQLRRAGIDSPGYRIC
jgi:hypothetical protein